MDRPNTIWISLRKPPPVSPNARVRPVTIMMMTAMILATGPSMDWRMLWSGASHGIDEPDAWAVGASTRLMARVDAAVAMRRVPREIVRIMKILLCWWGLPKGWDA